MRDEETQGHTGIMVKLSLCLTKYHVMKTYGGVDVYFHAFLTSALDGGELSSKLYPYLSL
jgi:hypothetical protein